MTCHLNFLPLTSHVAAYKLVFLFYYEYITYLLLQIRKWSSETTYVCASFIIETVDQAALYKCSSGGQIQATLVLCKARYKMSVSMNLSGHIGLYSNARYAWSPFGRGDTRNDYRAIQTPSMSSSCLPTI